MAKPPLVLLVDDTPLMRQVYSDILVQHDFEVRTATHALEALEAAAAHPPDVVLMDFTMPGLDGIEAARRLKADPRTASVPVVLFSGEDVAAEARNAGCDAVLPKPCRTELLVATVRAQLRAR
jgi:two-component system, cell cycle response regulator DivK